MAGRFSDGDAPNSIEAMAKRLAEPPVTGITLEEGQRQAVLLALAKLSLQRPGWLWMLNEISLKMDNDVDGKAQMFEALRALHAETDKVGV